MTTPPAAAPAPTAPPRAETARPSDDPSSRRSRDDFERALRQKSKARDDDESELGAEDGETPEPPSAMAALMTWAAPLPIKQAGGEAGAATAAGAMLGGNEGATTKALQTALNNAPEAVAPTATPAQAAWEVTLRQPLGVPLDLKANRNTEAGAHGWQLTIGSPVVDASMLARHVPRLNERLMARGLMRDHAHIEESDPEAQS